MNVSARRLCNVFLTIPIELSSILWFSKVLWFSIIFLRNWHWWKVTTNLKHSNNIFIWKQYKKDTTKILWANVNCTVHDFVFLSYIRWHQVCVVCHLSSNISVKSVDFKHWRRGSKSPNTFGRNNTVILLWHLISRHIKRLLDDRNCRGWISFDDDKLCWMFWERWFLYVDEKIL